MNQTTAMKRFSRAKDLLDELGITEPEEIDLEAIAQHVGATVIRERLQGTEARIVGVDDRAIITVNQDSLPTRQRFSIGHELGHWMNDRGRIDLACSTDKQERFYTGTDKESLANEFATELLLPSSMFTPRLGKQPPTLEIIKDLARTFRASFTATARRTVVLGAHPAMVVCSTINKRVWFKASSELEGLLWPNAQTSNDTLAAALLRRSGFGEATDEVDTGAWIDHEDAANYVLVESSVKVTPELVVSVLWWKDQAQIRDLLEDGR
jgi:Zn-dependent peptidase ImmA (M78 family)